MVHRIAGEVFFRCAAILELTLQIRCLHFSR
jgi:hypothetical protein